MRSIRTPVAVFTLASMLVPVGLAPAGPVEPEASGHVFGPSPARIEVHEWYGAMAFTADGRSFFAASDQEVVAFELRTGVRRELTRLQAEPLALEAGPGPAEVTLVLAGGEVNRVSAAGPLRAAGLPPPGSHRETLALARQGALRATYNAETHRLEVSGPGTAARLGFDFPDAPDGVRLSADGRVLAIYAEEELSFWSVAEASPLGRIPDPGSTESFALSPDGETVATWSEQTVLFWTPTGDAVWGRLTHAGAIERLVFSHDGRTALSGSDAGQVLLWDLDRRLVRTVRQSDSATIRGLALAPDGGRMAVQADDFLEIWGQAEPASAAGLRTTTVPLDLEVAEGGALQAMPGWQSQGRVSRGDAVSGLAPAADGGVWFAIGDGSLARTSADGTEEDPVLEGAGPGLQVAASPNGSWVFAAGPGLALTRLAGADKPALALAATTEPIFAMACLPGNGPLAVATPGRLKLFSPATGGAAGEIPLAGGLALALAPFPDGGRLAVGSEDGRVRILDVASRREVKTFDAHQGAVTAVAVSPDGSRIATASTGLLDRSVKVFDAGTGAERLRLVGHPRPPGALAFSRHGRHLISAGGPDCLLFWDLEAGKWSGYLETMPEDVSVLVTGPKGALLAIGTSEGIVEVWVPGPED